MSDSGRFGVRVVARVGAVGVVEKMVGRRAVLADRDLAVGLALQEPVGFARGDVVGRGAVARASWLKLLEAAPLMPSSMRVAGRPVVGDLGFAGELDAVLLERVGADVGVALDAVVPEEHGLVDPARNRQADLAVALASRRRLELGDALLEIGAAIAAEIRRLGRCPAHQQHARRREQRQTAPDIQ